MNLHIFKIILYENCTGLTSVTIPNSVTSFKGRCFEKCSSLTSVTLPDTITSLGDSCFRQCTGLTSIIIPNSVTLIQDCCFDGCTSLNDYYLNWTSSSTIITYYSSTMPNNTNTIFHIPAGTKQLYIDKSYPASKLDEPISYIDCTFTERNSKSILSKEDGDIAYLDAQLIDSGGNPVAVSGVGIDFYQDNTLLDTVQTDSTGKATYSYTSQGVGDTVFSVGLTISGNYVSKTYSIEDFIKTFKLDGTDNYRTFRSSSKSFNNGVMTAKSCVAYGFENLNSFRLEFEWLGGYGIIMPSNVRSIDKNWIQIWSTGGYVYINGSRNNLPTFSEPFVPMDDGFYKVILEKDNGTYRFKVEDTVICEFTNVPSATEWAVGIDHYSTSNNKIRNIKVKPLY